MATAPSAPAPIFKSLKFFNRSTKFKVTSLTIRVKDEGDWRLPDHYVREWEAKDCYVKEIAPKSEISVPDLDKRGPCLPTHVECVATVVDVKSGDKQDLELEQEVPQPGQYFDTVTFGIKDPPKSGKTTAPKAIPSAQLPRPDLRLYDPNLAGDPTDFLPEKDLRPINTYPSTSPYETERNHTIWLRNLDPGVLVVAVRVNDAAWVFLADPVGPTAPAGRDEKYDLRNVSKELCIVDRAKETSIYIKYTDPESWQQKRRDAHLQTARTRHSFTPGKLPLLTSAGVPSPNHKADWTVATIHPDKLA